MWLIIRSCVRTFYYKLFCFKKIKITCLNLFYKCSRIKIKKGKAIIKDKLQMKNNAMIYVNDGGIIEIGKSVSINFNSIVACHKMIVIGNNVAIGPNVCIYDHDHKFNKNGMQEGYNASDIIIEDNVWIGANCVILRGTHIGRNTVIGAGCIVKGKIPSNSLVKQNRENIVEKLHD